jgi:undecaprenyl-diphosphatase
MSYIEILILAVIQGAAELLPVSSSAHVILAARLMKQDTSSPEFVFLLLMLHTGTMFAVLVYFWSRWKALLTPSESAGGDRWHFAKKVLLATIATGFVGLCLLVLIEYGLKMRVEDLFKNLPIIGTGLLTVGILIIVAGILEDRVRAGSLTFANSIWIGVIQGVCLPFRGFSRSGATISLGLLRGIPRPLAEDFSFALAVLLTPPVLALSVHRLLKAREWLDSGALFNMLLPGLVGMGMSFLAGLVALRLLSSALEGGRWKWFGFYCLAASAVVYTVFAMGL